MKAILRWLSCLAFIMLCSQVLAHSMEDRISELEKQMKEVGTTNPLGTYGAGFTSATPQTCYDWYVVVEPLYWHAKAGGTEYAYTDKSIDDIPVDLFLPNIKGRVKDQTFGWDWGLRFGVGRHFEHDNWDVYLNYTWFEADSTSNVHKNLPAAIIALKLGFTAPFQRAKSYNDLNYNNLNFEIGRYYFISSKVSVRPQIGLKSSWIFDRQNVQYNLSLDSNLIGPGQAMKVRDKSVLWGMGPRAGVEAEWSIGDGFSLYGKAVGALLYGYFRTSYQLRASPDATMLGDDFKIHLTGNNHLFVPNLQMMLGLIWQRCINKGRQHITLGAGYEVEYFWRANQTMEADGALPSTFTNLPNPRFSVFRYSEDIMFYGITLKVRLDF